MGQSSGTFESEPAYLPDGSSHSFPKRDDLEKSVEYVLAGKDNPVKREKLSRYLHRRSLGRASGVARDQLESMPVPQLPAIDNFRFNYSLDELLKMSEAYTRNRKVDIDRVMRYAIIMCGLRLGDTLGLKDAHLDDGYEIGNRFPRITGSVHKKRLSMRVVPTNAWGGFDSNQWSPFVLNGAGGRRISIDSFECAQVPALFFGDSIHTIAYLAKGRNGEYCLTANPLQNCSHDCSFCCRDYGGMTQGYKSQLINFTPKEMARYLRVAFDNLDFYDVTEIAFITGVFPNDTFLLNYVEEFLDEMLIVTSGRFNPRQIEHQRMKISSHLLRTEEAMLAAKDLGVKRFTYTLELIDPWQRAMQMDLARAAGSANDSRQVLPLTQVAHQPSPTRETFSSRSALTSDKGSKVTVKGSASFENVMQILATACRVFGQDEVEPVLVVGLDTYDDTVRGVRELQREGYSMLTRALFNAYGPDQVPLYRMTLPETIGVTELINQAFGSGHQQVVDLSDSHVTRFNPIG